jgi:uncharacterized membrane protein
MSVRVGESWQARNGHRRFVSMPLHDVLALGLLGAVVVLPLWALWWMVVIEVWLAAETLVLLFTGALVAAALIARSGMGSDVTLTKLRFGLWMVDLKGKR